MKIIEEYILKDTIEYIKRFEAKQQSLENCYQKVGELNLFSLQSLSYQFDKEFFDEVSFVLSVIITIIKHPQIASFDIDEIIRSDLAGHIENDSFQMVFKDPKLWRDKNNEMIPEEVYYHEHIDEIKIYENIFIGMLINLIEQDLKQHHHFYISLLPSLSTKKALVTSDEIKYALNKIEQELKKIRYIKETFFYKQIKTCNLNLRKIIPTNILLKNRLYNHCFKFYKKFIRYDDTNSLYQDFTKYYFYLLLQQLKKHKATFIKTDDNSIYLDYQGFQLAVSINSILPIININITKGQFQQANKLLCLVDMKELEKLKASSDFDYIITIWNTYFASGEQINLSSETEAGLINTVTDQMMTTIKVDKEIYQKICPLCKNNHVNIEQDIYYCDHCGTKYGFIDEATIWLLQTRRK